MLACLPTTSWLVLAGAELPATAVDVAAAAAAAAAATAVHQSVNICEWQGCSGALRGRGVLLLSVE
jgi:hypothetical protein